MAEVPAPLRRAMRNPSLRYLLAVVIGLLIDITMAYMLRTQLHLPTVLSAMAGFCCGVLVNYVNFEKWVFGRGNLSWINLFRVFTAAQSALIVRLAVVWILSQLALPTLLIFGIAIGVSFITNFFLSRLAIRGKTAADRIGPST